MSNEKSMALVPATLDEAKEMARLTSLSSLLPAALRGKVEDVFVTIVAGNELGLAPMQAIRSMHIISGRPVLSAELMVALCKRRRDVCRYFQLVESTATIATYKTHREGDPEPTTMSYTIGEAKAAGLLNNPTWQKHPAAMLRARASSFLARAVFQDLVLGILEEDEAREMETRDVRDGAVDVEATPVAEPTVTDEAPPALDMSKLQEVDVPMATGADSAPLMDFEVVRLAMNAIKELAGDSTEQKRARTVAYYGAFGFVGVPGPRWNPGRVWQGLTAEERAAVMGRVAELAAKYADDLPKDWGVATGAPEPVAERVVGADDE